MLFHDSNPYVLEVALNSMKGIKDVYIFCDWWLINDEITKSNSKIYPNPANESVTIELPYQSKSEYSIKIYSSDGRLVEELKTRESKILNTETYKVGLYLFEIYNNNRNELERHKISIVR